MCKSDFMARKIDRFCETETNVKSHAIKTQRSVAGLKAQSKAFNYFSLCFDMF